MTANSPPYALQAGSHSAQLFRQAISTLLNPAGGIVGSGDLAVTQNGTPNMSVNVAGGAPGSGGGIWIPGTTSAGVQGLYYGFNDAVANLAIAASNPTNPRIDVPIAQVQDAAYAGATNSFQLAVVTGTPAGSPAVPSLPASSLALANVAVAANATTIVTANITDKRALIAGAAGTVGPGAWSAASLAGGVSTGSGAQVASSRLEPAGGVVRLCGQVANTSGSTITAGTTLATIAVGTRPGASLRSPVPVSVAGTVVLLTITSAGTLSIIVGLANADFIILDGVTFRIT